MADTADAEDEIGAGHGCGASARGSPAIVGDVCMSSKEWTNVDSVKLKVECANFLAGEFELCIGVGDFVWLGAELDVDMDPVIDVNFDPNENDPGDPGPDKVVKEVVKEVDVVDGGFKGG